MENNEFNNEYTTEAVTGTPDTETVSDTPDVESVNDAPEVETVYTAPEVVALPSEEDKKTAVTNLSKSALKHGILSLVIPSAIILPVTVGWCVWYGYTLMHLDSYSSVSTTAFAGVAVFMLIAAIICIPGIVLGRIAWKRGNLARAGAIDLGIRTPAKAVVGKVFGIICFFSYIASIALLLLYAIIFFACGAGLNMLF